jgi:hypothetical protein
MEYERFIDDMEELVDKKYERSSFCQPVWIHVQFIVDFQRKGDVCSHPEVYSNNTSSFESCWLRH